MAANKCCGRLVRMELAVRERTFAGQNARNLVAHVLRVSHGNVVRMLRVGWITASIRRDASKGLGNCLRVPSDACEPIEDALDFLAPPIARRDEN